MAGGLEDKYSEVTDMSMKLLEINATTYEEHIFDSAKAKYIAEKPYFLTFINTKSQHVNMHSEALQDLAIHYQGKIQFSYSNIVLDEKISLAYDIPSKNNGPFSFLIDTDGIAYNYNLVMPSLNVTSEWIDKKHYLSTPLQYKVPPQLSDLKLKWAYVKKEVR